MSDQSYKFSEYQVPKSEVTVFAVSWLVCEADRNDDIPSLVSFGLTLEQLLTLRRLWWLTREL
jgi:hypothetical protein